jgi:hypothetical protein
MCNDIFKKSKTQIEKIYRENSQKKVINKIMIIIRKTQIHILCLNFFIYC